MSEQGPSVPAFDSSAEISELTDHEVIEILENHPIDALAAGLGDEAQKRIEATTDEAQSRENTATIEERLRISCLKLATQNANRLYEDKYGVKARGCSFGGPVLVRKEEYSL